MQSEKGFSLLEVIASLVLISIVLLSIFPLFNSAKKTTDSNTDRLVIINLADATLNRLKIDPFGYIDKPSDKPNYLFEKKKSKDYSLSSCSSDECKDYYSIKLNGQNYFIEVKATQDGNEANNKLINIVVTAKNEKGNINYSVEGYVSYE